MSTGQVRASDIVPLHIDRESIRDVEGNPEAVQFRIELSAAPSEYWVHEFDRAYRRLVFDIKPPVVIDEASIVVDYLPRYEDEFQSFLKKLTETVREANDEIARTQNIKSSQLSDNRKPAFKDRLRNIKLPDY